jgi:hypothetical protein
MLGSKTGGEKHSPTKSRKTPHTGTTSGGLKSVGLGGGRPKHLPRDAEDRLREKQNAKLSAENTFWERKDDFLKVTRPGRERLTLGNNDATGKKDRRPVSRAGG